MSVYGFPYLLWHYFWVRWIWLGGVLLFGYKSGNGGVDQWLIDH
jgi:hypothetical protein